MIVHLAPRRVTLVSKEDGRQTGIPIDLNAVLAVDLQVGRTEQVALIVRLTNGERVVAGIYPRMAEAGPDCGRLRVLAGLSAWTDCMETPGRAARRPRRLLMAATLVLAAALIAFVLAAMGLQGTLSAAA
jgi:hypothetical protein